VNPDGIWKKKRTSLEEKNRQLNREVENWRRRYEDQVEEINNLLERKSASWVTFFNRLEEALPPGCYLLALNPPASASSREFGIRVAVGSREELGHLIKTAAPKF